MSQGPSGLDRAVINIIDTSSTTIYFGKAVPGSLLSAGVWQIQRVTNEQGIVTFEWADGDRNFDNIWDDRTGTSYS